MMNARDCKLPRSSLCGPARLAATVVALGLLGVSGCATSPELAATAGRNPPFILGADISWVQEDESRGARFYDHGVRKDIVTMLREHGFNYVRLRVFVDPKSPKGYARKKSEAFNDIAHTVAMAKRARAAGMGVFLSFHYSDSWADPENQPKPVAWRKMSFPQLVRAARAHTRAALLAFKAAGVTPGIVGVGNEITHGMLWPDGRVGSTIPSGNPQTDANAAQLAGTGNYDNFAALLEAGIAEVRSIFPSSRVLLHHHLGRHNRRVREWVDNLQRRGVRFDIIGLSCYAQGTEGDWRRNFADLAARYPRQQLLVVEYSARKRYLNDLMFNLPGGRGLGTFIWEPTRHREALFDKDGKNAGGGQAENFVADFGINQGAAPAPPDAAAGRVRRWHGGRYDANAFLDLYPIMARDYGLTSATVPAFTRTP